MKCANCNEVPHFHSFDSMCKIDGTEIFYCFPAHNKRSVQSREDMLNFISHFPQDRKWSVLFHANGYGMQHMMPIPTAIEMGKLTQENPFLQKVYIVEGSWFMTFLLRCIFPFLGKHITEKFVLLEGSLLEVVTQLKEEGFALQDLKPMLKHFGKKIEG
jgi:CRAL/TRIO domain